MIHFVVKLEMWNFHHIICTLLKKIHLKHFEKEKMSKITFFQLLFALQHPYISSKYCQNVINYAMDMTMIIVICPKCHWCPYIYSILGKKIEQNMSKSILALFLVTGTHKRTPWWWHQFYSLNFSVVETPSAEWCSKRTFPHKGDSGVYIELLGKMVVLPPVLFKQPAIVNNYFVSPTN
jgi:hypothetical protein